MRGISVPLVFLVILLVLVVVSSLVVVVASGPPSSSRSSDLDDDSDIPASHLPLPLTSSGGRPGWHHILSGDQLRKSAMVVCIRLPDLFILSGCPP